MGCWDWEADLAARAGIPVHAQTSYRVWSAGHAPDGHMYYWCQLASPYDTMDPTRRMALPNLTSWDAPLLRIGWAPTVRDQNGMPVQWEAAAPSPDWRLPFGRRVPRFRSAGSCPAATIATRRGDLTGDPRNPCSEDDADGAVSDSEQFMMASIARIYPLYGSGMLAP